MIRARKFFVSIVTIINLSLGFPFAPVFAQEATTAPLSLEQTPIETSSTTPSAPIDTSALDEALAVSPDSSSPILPSDALPLEESAVTEPPLESQSMMTEEEQVAPRPIDMAISGRQSVKADESTGALLYEYPINIPKGRNGMEPELSLHYNNQVNENTIYGSGWNDSLPFIERVNKRGTEKLLTDNYFTSSLDGELVQTATTTYRAKIENGNFNSYTFENNTWTVTTKAGNTYEFGYSTDARQDNPSDSAKVYKWMVEQVRDTDGNSVDYSYYKDAGQIYPASISYTNNASSTGIFEVEFLRESRNDVATSSVSGFPVATKQRIKEILVRTNGELTHRYVLSYSVGNNGYRSLFSAIQESGWDSAQGTTTLPAVQFGYSTSTDGWTQNTDSNKWQLPGGKYFVREPGTDGGGRVLDLNSDNLPDMLWNGGYWDSGSYYPGDNQAYFNTGEGWATSTENYSSEEPFIVPFDMGLRFGDVNGDGYIDEVVSRTLPTNPRTDYKAVYLGSATGWTATSSWNPPVPFVDTYALYSDDSYTRLVDVNGDGLADIVGHYGPYLNNGKEFAPSSSYALPTNLSDAGVRIVDVNGDGLVDVVRARYYVCNGATYYCEDRVAYLNNGHGWEETTGFVWPSIFFAYLSSSDVGYRFADVNGDNLTDIVRRGSNNGYVGEVYMNTGNGWNQASSTFPTTTVHFPDGGGVEDLGVNIDDVNGDGLPDVIKNRMPFKYGEAPVYQEKEVWIKNGVKADTLTSITTEAGATTTVTYAHSAELDNGTQLNPDLQFNFDVVKNIATNPGLGGSISTTTYAYSDGIYHGTNIFDRKFAGFAKITKTNPAGNITKTYYHQGTTTNNYGGKYDDDISKINKTYRIEQYDNASNLYSLTVNKWDKYTITASSTFVKLAQTTQEDFDGNSGHKDKAESYSYDNSTGNLSEKISWGEVTGSSDGSFTDTGTDKATSAYSYSASSTNSTLSLPSRELVTDQSSNTVKDTKWYYDGLSFGSFDKGNSTKEEKLISDGIYASTTKTYDATYGLVTQEKDTRGNATDYSYDSHNLFVATSTNPLGYTRSFSYDYSSGKVATTTDENGYVFAVVYDGLDRVKEEKQPDQTTPTTLVTKSTYSYTDTALQNAVQKTNYFDGSLTNTAYSYQDGLGRTIQTRTQAEGSNTYTVNDTVFNNRGLVEKESLPYFASSTSRTSVTTNNALYASYTYDALGRVTQISNAVGNTTNAYDDWKVTTTDARGKQKIFTKDAYGNLVKVEEKNGGDTYTTNYEYNLLGNLTKITDALSNVRNFTYDKLGRRLTAEDLHASGDETYGSWSYSYDDAGNMTQSVDPKSQTVNYAFDTLNRNTTENYTGQAGTEVTYTYDDYTNGKMRLCQADSTGAITSYTYNPLGGVSTEEKTISGVSATTAYEYDRQGNQTIITYPDDSQSRYSFNTAGQPNRIEHKENGGTFADVVSEINYSPTGQITNITYANGFNTVNTYDAEHLYRLINKKTLNYSTAYPSANTNPVITLTGSNLVNVNIGDNWTEPGYTATDEEDGDITGSVTVIGSVSTTTAGVYQLVYNVVDSNSVPAAGVVRTVAVHATSTSMTVKALVVGGGGGGGYDRAGGGGAGGYLYNSAFSIVAIPYAIAVGVGGTGGVSSSAPGNGATSSFSTMIASGGGRSGGAVAPGYANSGGSGGGAYGQNFGGGELTGGAAFPSGQGYSGGNGLGPSTYGGGGGGGCGESGQSATTGQSGRGGNGCTNNISGTSETYAGGGGAGKTNLGSTYGAGGSGGGGSGGTTDGATGSNGTANTGGGGGGGANNPQGNGGSGGSGIVIIAYHSDGTDGVSASSTGGTITTSGEYKIHKFTSGGTFTAVSSSVSTSTNPVITLTGSNLINIDLGDTWTEPGYSATDAEDGDITSSVTVTGSVSTSTVGTYQLIYNVVDSNNTPAAGVARTVVVHGVNTNPVITLTGSNLINLKVGDNWSEPGYSATDTEDGNITSSVTVTGSVSTSTTGIYQLAYNVVDSSDAPAVGIIRTIVVGNATNTNPVIALTGSTLVDINVGDNWTEPGYSASDEEDGDITSSVTVTGSVSTSTVGIYQLKYNVVDSSGAPASGLIRTIVVHATTTSMSVKALVLGAGGGGGYRSSSYGGAGGGGGGGYQYNANFSISPGNYSITVGTGQGAQTNGGNSIFSTITAYGGGAGGQYSSAGSNGGCGGGGGGQANGGTVSGGSGSQGYSGGNNAGYRAFYYPGAGGGGAGAVGGNATAGNVAGNGGSGISNTITGSSVIYAGGGAGSLYNSDGSATGGSGGGGNAGTNGTANLGGGGGGGANPGNGGSGVVIVSYHTDGRDGISTSSTGGTITTSGDYTIHKFTSNSTFGAVGTGYATGTNPTITLTGSNLMDLNVDDSWTEPGYSATDPLYGNITASTTVTGSVTTAVPGTYQLAYNVTNVAGVPAAGVMRTVVVHPVNENPTITLTGSNLINLDLGESFAEPGYSATDTEDGNITSSVTITGTVSSFKSGTYHLIYNVTDSSGAPAAGIVRTIVVHPTFNSLQNLNYAYDQNGNITEIIDGSTISTARGVTYSYDDLNRLTSATIHTASTTETLTYAYSAIGNISSSTESGAYAYAGTNYVNPHAATEIGTASMLYDNSGNLTSDGAYTYQWDYRNRLTLSGNGTASSTNIFDSGMNRVKLTEGGISTYFPNRYFNQIGTTGTTTKHLFVGDLLVATIEQIGTSTPITHYIHTDHLGGTNIVTNQNGLIQTLDYLPFGTTRINDKTGSYSERRQFAGTEHETNGLNYMMNRFQNPIQGRFISQDPVFWSPKQNLSNPQSLNSYSYANNNPITGKDPLGLFNIKTGSVEKGDTLGAITSLLNKTYNTSYSISKIADLNTISNVNKIYVGQTIVPNQKVPDISASLNSFMKTNASTISSLPSVVQKPYFVGMVFPTIGPWDVKVNNPAYKSSTYKDGFVFLGEKIRKDAPGNINYGFSGKAAGFSDSTLVGGASTAQVGWDLVHGRVSNGDNGGDAAYIQQGINLYSLYSNQ